MSKFKITPAALRRIINEELLREEEEAAATPDSSSKNEVIDKLKELIGAVGDIPATQYGAFLAVLDEVLELAKAEKLKEKAKQIVTGLNKFD